MRWTHSCLLVFLRVSRVVFSCGTWLTKPLSDRPATFTELLTVY